MQQAEQKTDVIIIGGGIAGLAAATFLGREGKAVRLLEQSHALGGRARTKVQDDFYLNIGPHALYRGAHGIKILHELGVETRGGRPSVSGAYAIERGVKHTFPSGLVSMLTTGLLDLPAKIEAARWLESVGKLDGEAVMSVSLRDWLNKEISHNSVKDLLMAVFRVTTYVNAPDLMSAGAAIEQLKLAFGKGVLYLDGGWQTLVEGLNRAAERARVVIERGAKVESVERDGAGAVSAVRLVDGRMYQASSVVIASSPSIAAELVGRSERSSLAQWAEAAIPVKAACLDLALGSLPKPKATFALGIDRPHYLSVHSASARLAPTGAALVHLAKYLPPDHNEPADSVERELEATMDLVQPGWREVVAYRRFLPEMTVMNAIPLARNEGTRGRPGPEVQDVPGLYVIGDWVGSEGLLADASLASAKRAAQLITAPRIVRLAATG